MRCGASHTAYVHGPVSPPAIIAYADAFQGEEISTTMNIYTHIAPEWQKEATEKMSSVLWPGASNGLVSELVSKQENGADIGHSRYGGR